MDPTEVQANGNDHLALVSSLYGPGNVIGWFLVVTGCLVSWTLHISRRRSGSIDANFIAAISFPVMAAGHLIAQIQQYPKDEHLCVHVEDANLQAKAYAIEASVVILDSAIPACAALAIISAYFQSGRRAFCVEICGVFCLAAQVYLHLRITKAEEPADTFSRRYLVNWTNNFLAIVGITALLSLGAILLAGHVFIRNRRHGSRPKPDIEVVRGSAVAVRTSKAKPSERAMTTIWHAAWLSGILFICAGNLAGNAWSFSRYVLQAASPGQ